MWVNENHPLIRLTQSLPWRELSELIFPDFKLIRAGSWWLGRKLKVRQKWNSFDLMRQSFKRERAPSWLVIAIAGSCYPRIVSQARLNGNNLRMGN